jgi:DNA-binding HxlR family transcriptional regulator
MTMPCSPIGCPMDALLRLLMGPWTTYVLYVLRTNGPTRFGELKRRVAGVSAKVLTARLRMLEESDIVVRHYEPTIPPQVTYALSPRGLELADVIDRLDQVAKKWRDEDAVRAKPAAPAKAPAAKPGAKPAAPQPSAAD